MKRKWMALLCLALAFALPLSAFAAETNSELNGFVLEVAQDGFLMRDAELGEVWLNTDETTVWMGVLADGPVEVGQYVTVQYDGRLTRSIPPQAHADRVECYRVSGTVAELLEDGVLLTGDEVLGEVIVHLAEGQPHVYLDMPITVYYDGMVMMSLPGQINASAVVVPELTGVVSDRTDEGFTLTDAEGQAYEVKLTAETLVTVAQEDNEQPEEEATLEDEAQPEEEAALEDDEQPEEEAVLDGEEQLSLEWGDGETVTVLYNGTLTKSTPPQLTALEISLHP